MGSAAMEEEALRHHAHLMDVIRQVHGEHGDDLCFMQIDRIFEAAGLPVPDRRVGDKEAMKRNCDRFIDVMCQGGGWPTYAELEAVVRRLAKAEEGEDDVYEVADEAAALVERMPS